MKIKKILFKNSIIQYFLSLVAALYIYFVSFSSSIKISNKHIPNYFWENKKPFILVFWHSQLMMISFSWKFKKKINILASGHSDGRFGALIGNYFNLRNIKTSDNKKNLSLRPVFKILNSNEYIGITPDGPRGPKEKISEGVIKIANKTKIPIIPIGFWSSKNFSLKSWDSFLITYPFSKCSFVWGKPIKIEGINNKEQIKKYQMILEQQINLCIKEAKLKCR